MARNDRSVLLAGWGNFRPVHCRLVEPSDDGRTAERWISRGMGRSYGDSAVNGSARVASAGLVVDQRRRRSILSFDPNTGRLRAEAGSSLAEIIEHVVAQGFFLPVTPGTQFVTLGGALAADVHGKNHHRDGSIAQFVEEFTLRTPTGERMRCRPDENSEVFHATLGGMGLTGAIEEATLRLMPVETTRIRVESHRTGNLDETLDRVEETAGRCQYSVSWIDPLSAGDSLGRGWVLAGDHASVDDLPRSERANPLSLARRRKLSVPFFLPSFVLSRWSCRAFNERIYRQGITKGDLTDLESFFYPLDRVADWNRIYGRRGFIEYQAVLPPESARKGIRRLLTIIASSGHAAFFAGIKSSGAASGGPLSFLYPGMTIGLDMPAARGIEDLVSQLDVCVLEHGGRVYLAKDALLTADSFRRMYPRLDEFQAVRRRLDPQGRIRSNQAVRLGLVDP